MNLADAFSFLRYPVVAFEILTSDIDEMNEILLDTPAYLEMIIGFFERCVLVTVLRLTYFQISSEVTGAKDYISLSLDHLFVSPGSKQGKSD
jgi:hypothetical protein